MTDKGTVLVTGGSGYIAGWCIAELLNEGYEVRTTLRDLSKAPEVQAAIATATNQSSKLKFYAANLNSDEGWQTAVDGCDYVMHVASPLGIPLPKNPDDLIRPARDGALRVIDAAIRARVKRVVLTSSVAAVKPGFDESEGFVSDESVWTNIHDLRVGAYEKSKTIAERAAWDIIASSRSKTTLSTVNPSLVLGPVLGKDFSDSLQVVQRLLSGRLPAIPRLGFCVVDVRDVAKLHVLAMTQPEAAGQRFIAAGEYAWVSDIANLLRASLGTDASKVPNRRLPSFLMRLASLFDRDLRAITPGLDKRSAFTSAKAEKLLGWKMRPMKETVLDCARSLISAGLVGPTSKVGTR